MPAQVARSPSDGGAINPAGKPHTACCGTIQLRTWTIKAQITAGILSVSGALLATLTLVSVVSVFVLGGNTRQLAADALEEQIRTNAANFSSAYAKEIQQTLTRRAAACETVAAAASHAFYAEDPWEFSSAGGNASLWVEFTAQSAGALPESARGQTRHVDAARSGYYIPKTKSVATPEGCTTGPNGDPSPSIGEDMRATGCYGLKDRLDGPSDDGSGAARHARDRSAVLEVYLKQFVQSMPDVSLVYIGYEASGLFRQFPASDGYYTASEFPVTYDPRKRPWYRAAKSAADAAGSLSVSGTGNVLGPVGVSEPYKDYSTGDWTVTVAQAVFNPNRQSELMGVVGFDISIDAIQKHIVDEVTFLEGGVVALVESEPRSETGGQLFAVAHVDFATHISSDDGAPFLSVLEPDLVGDAALLREAVGGGSGVADFTRNGKPYVVAYTTVAQPHKYTVLTIVPRDEVLAPIEPMRQLIAETEGAVTGSVVGVTLATAVVVSFFVVRIAGGISAPVATMVKVSRSIVSGAAEKDLAKNLSANHMRKLEQYAQVKDSAGRDRSEEVVVNEMVNLTRSFLSMTQGLKKDSNRAKTRVVHPDNPYYVARENRLMNMLHENDEGHWTAGNAPVSYANAIAMAVPVGGGGGGGGGSVPIAVTNGVVPIAPAVPVI